MKASMRNQIVWVGIRESDIANTEDLFAASITIFGSGKGANRSMEAEKGVRINHNGECAGYLEFLENAIRSVLNERPDVYFMQYDALDGISLPRYIKNRFVCQNDEALLEWMNQKVWQKEHVSSLIDCLPFVTMAATSCTEGRLRSQFPEAQELVIQEEESYGGSGTWHVRLDDFRKPEFRQDTSCVVVSEYVEKSIPVNIHCVVYSDEVVLFPPSIQLINQDTGNMEYIGADFSTYQTLTSEQRKRLDESARKICFDLQARGYRGVCGIDFLLMDDRCCFMEVNGRFQASTAFLNRRLAEAGYYSVHAYHVDAFEHMQKTLPTPPRATTGGFVTLSHVKGREDEIRYLHRAGMRSSEFHIVDDGLDWNREMEPRAYAFKLESENAISCVTFQGTVRVHPNLTLTSFDVTSESDLKNVMRIKTMLLARGVQVSEKTWERLEDMGGADCEEFDAITLRLFREFWVTTPCNEKWNRLSPLRLIIRGGKPFLTYCNRLRIAVDIIPFDSIGERKTAKGHFYHDVAYLSPDRLRVFHRDGCIFQSRKTSCKFCDLIGTGRRLFPSEIREVLLAYNDHERVNHYLIGGGSNERNMEFSNILQVTRLIREQSDKHIYLMSLPIVETNRLELLRENGVTEIAFNLEVFDRDIAKKIMPGKAANSLQYYMKSLENAANVFGKRGEVRSAILVGIDDLDTFREGVEMLCKIGVVPILSLFRATEGTEMESYMPLNEADALKYFREADAICRKYGLTVGPSCPACQNNTLAFAKQYT